MFLAWENKSGKSQIISGKFQNNGNAIKDIKQISLSHVIMFETCGFTNNPNFIRFKWSHLCDWYLPNGDQLLDTWPLKLFSVKALTSFSM